jgi:putative hemolysin
MTFQSALYDGDVVHERFRPKAHSLRYRVFFEEMGAAPSGDIAAQKRDFDVYDAICDHLLVVEHGDAGAQVVGTYRLLRAEPMKKVGLFYSESEFDISAIKRYPGNILEVGRSCVDKNFRNRAVMQLLWRGIGAYVARFEIALMFGCASFQGTDPQAHAMALSYLHHYHLAPERLCPSALPNRFVNMDLMPRDAVNAKQAFTALPALIKGYLRLSGYIGLGAVIDPVLPAYLLGCRILGRSHGKAGAGKHRPFHYGGVRLHRDFGESEIGHLYPTPRIEENV